MRLCKDRQTGGAAIEFAIVFPVFFMIFYAIVTYGLIMVAQQSITLAAEEGARAALRYSATGPEDNARAAALNSAAWLADRLDEPLVERIDCSYDTSANCYRVTVTYPDYQENPLVPLILGPLMGVIVPERLSSTAVVQVD